MRDVYEKLNFPEGTYVNKTLDLSHFLEAKGITEIDKWVINNKIEKITIKRLLNVYNTNLKRKIKDGIDYSELLVIEVKINDNKAIYDAQRVVAKAIIYPTLLIIRFNDKFKFGMYKNRDNKRDNLQNTYSDIYFTGWLDLNNRYGRINDIITDLVFDNCSDITNFYDLYKYYYRKIKDYKSVYVPLKIITLFLKVNKFCPSSSIKKEILQNCEYICVNPNEKSTLDLFKKSRYEKYENPSNYTKIVVCLDEIYNIIKKYNPNKIYSFNTLLIDYKEFCHELSFRITLSKRTSDSCYYWSMYSSCTHKENYEQECTSPSTCPFYKTDVMEDI